MAGPRTFSQQNTQACGPRVPGPGVNNPPDRKAASQSPPVDSRDRERQPCPRTLPHCHLSSSGEPPPIPHPPAGPPTGWLHGHHFHLCSYGAMSQAAGSQQAEPLYTADTPSKLRAFEFPPFPPFGSPKSRAPLISRTVLRISWMIRRPGPPWARCSVRGTGVAVNSLPRRKFREMTP